MVLVQHAGTGGAKWLPTQQRGAHKLHVTPLPLKLQLHHFSKPSLLNLWILLLSIIFGRAACPPSLQKFQLQQRLEQALGQALEQVLEQAAQAGHPPEALLLHSDSSRVQAVSSSPPGTSSSSSSSSHSSLGDATDPGSLINIYSTSKANICWFDIGGGRLQIDVYLELTFQKFLFLISLANNRAYNFILLFRYI